MKEAHKTKRQLKTKLKEISTIIDESTGEVLSVETKSHKYLTGSKEEFSLIYEGIYPIMVNASQAETRIFFFFLLEKYRGKIEIGRKLRLYMAKKTDLNERTITRVLPSLVEKGLLVLHGDGMYQINPRYIHKGSTGERDSALKSVIEDGCKNC
jgi:hypothetical protein